MSQEGYKSSSSFEDKEEFGLSPYMFKSERTLAEVENLIKKLELKQSSPQDESPEKYKSWKHRLMPAPKHVKQ